jgi:hypothetical protein
VSFGIRGEKECVRPISVQKLNPRFCQFGTSLDIVRSVRIAHYSAVWDEDLKPSLNISPTFSRSGVHLGVQYLWIGDSVGYGNNNGYGR